MISPSTIDRIKELSIVEVVSHYIELKKNGTNSFRASSPFTNDKTPSFFVVPSKNIFKDFSTGLGGDAIKFVMEFQKTSFTEAIKDICKVTGEKIEYEESSQPSPDQDEREMLYKINASAAKRFANALINERIDANHWVYAELLTKRMFSTDTIAQWQIGYAPLSPSPSGEGRGEANEWQFLTHILREKALIKESVELGLVRDKNGRTYDAFRNRIMFPIHDQHGRIVGFGGRAQKEDKYNAKYINSNESRIFDKSKTLFGLHFAGTHIRKQGFAGLMEGYTDVISFHQANYCNVVGTCGTALTEAQCKLLKKYCSKIVLFPDPDNAGEASALRNMDLLMQEGFEVGVVPMPKIEGRKVDPDELTRMFPQMINV